MNAFADLSPISVDSRSELLLIGGIMKKHAETFLFDYLSTPSPTGFEVPGQRKWFDYVRQFADSVDSDTYGTAWATLKGTATDGPVVMLEAHADEIGYIIRHVTKEGFLHIDRVGGSDVATARGRRLDILGDKGVVRGIIGNTAIHLRRDSTSDEKAPKIQDLYVDVGASSPAEVAKMGLRIGHPAVYTDGAEKLGKDRIVGRALDNRMGGFIIACVLEALAAGKKRPAATVHVVNAVQEEIGGNGAMMIAHRLFPDVAIVLDVTHATDTPGIAKELHGETKLGEGPSVTHGTCNHPEVIKRLIEVADKEKIPLQHESSSRYSGTDTDKIFHVREGIASGLVSLPLRYMHSVVETAHMDDVNQTIELLTAFISGLKPGERFKVKL